jgi:hypothetical protein
MCATPGAGATPAPAPAVSQPLVLGLEFRRFSVLKRHVWPLILVPRVVSGDHRLWTPKFGRKTNWFRDHGVVSRTMI